MFSVFIARENNCASSKFSELTLHSLQLLITRTKLVMVIKKKKDKNPREKFGFVEKFDSYQFAVVFQKHVPILN